MQSLDPPPAVMTDPKSREIARIWVAHGQQHVVLDPSLWKDPAAWGVMLADLAQHVANACEQFHELDRKAILDRIKSGLDAEWSSPTDNPNGSV